MHLNKNKLDSLCPIFSVILYKVLLGTLIAVVITFTLEQWRLKSPRIKEWDNDVLTTSESIPTLSNKKEQNMNFIEQTHLWVKSEVLQGRIMVGLGIVLLCAIVAILRSQHELLKGTVIPLGLLLLVLIGYGSYILTSRPAFAAQSIADYHQTPEQTLVQVKAKHINDNKAGVTLLKWVYPSLILLSALALLFLTSSYLQGVALGVIMLSVATYIIDTGFVTRSNAFIAFLNNVQ